MIRKNKQKQHSRLQQFLLLAIGALTFGLSDVFIKLSIYLGVSSVWSNGLSRGGVIVLLSVVLFRKMMGHGVIPHRTKKMILLGVVFWLVYLFKVYFVVALSKSETLNSLEVYLVYCFLAGGLFLLGAGLNKSEISVLVQGALLGAAIFSMQVWALHGGDILQYGRLLGAKSSQLDSSSALQSENPLFAAYLGVSLCQMCLVRILYRKAQHTWVYGILLILGLSTFLAGSSRGATIAGALGLGVILFGRVKRLSVRRAFHIAIVLIGLSVVLIYSLDYTQTTLLERWQVTRADSNSKSVTRLDLWQGAAEQFWESWVFGSTLEVPNYNTYPHNLILEAFMVGGIILGLPFLMLFTIAGKRGLRCIGVNENSDMVIAVGIVYISASLFSGSIYGSPQFWLLVGLLVGMTSVSKRSRMIRIGNIRQKWNS
ncbi:O-antigen ligase family protein [Verrucomicrobiales bacterium]|nr:O-antigen ligase family protein [Verrucomicrobiales bacterium]